MTPGQWWDTSWNPVTGCTPISEACDHCYAARMATRLRGRFGYPADDPFRVTFHKERLIDPAFWVKPRRVFVCSMGDLFHEEVAPMWQSMVLHAAEKAPQHAYMLLTKRPERMHEFFTDNSLGIQLAGLPNLWLGVTVETQARADERIPVLLRIPAAKRFVSYEPALGPVDFSGYLGRAATKCVVCGLKYGHDAQIDVGTPHSGCRGLDWLIAGGETGPGARPAHPDWLRSVRDQCRIAGVPFWLKQMSGKEPIPEDLVIREMPDNAGGKTDDRP